MKQLLKVILLSICMVSGYSYSTESIVIVANTEDSSITLTRQQVRNLFMGGALPYHLDAVSLPPEHDTRVLFNTIVVGLTESRIQSYWAQMRFSGRKKPPKEISNELELIEYLKNNQGAVGYLPASSDIPKELTVLFTIN